MNLSSESGSGADEKPSIPQEYIKNRIECFGFTEVSDILRFLFFIVNSTLENSDYLYIREKIDRCLRNHDNGDNYFIALRELACDLDCILSKNKLVFSH